MDGPAMQPVDSPSSKAVHLPGQLERGFRNLTNSKRPVMKPEDVKDSKIRVPPEFHLQALFESLGAVVTQIAWPEERHGPAQNVVDGEENPPSRHLLRQVLRGAEAGGSHPPCVFLPDPGCEHQDVGQAERGAEADPEGRGQAVRGSGWKALNDEETDSIGKFEQAGLQVTRPDLKAFRGAIGSANEKIYKRYGEDNVKTFLKFVEDARKE